MKRCRPTIPDIAAAVAQRVARGEADAGIVIDGAGIGSAIAANKIAGIRAAMCTNETLARYSREHNAANVLTLGATLISRRRGEAHRRAIPRELDARTSLYGADREDRPARAALISWTFAG